jgi:hypothetical protein
MGIVRGDIATEKCTLKGKSKEKVKKGAPKPQTIISFYYYCIGI